MTKVAPYGSYNACAKSQREKTERENLEYLVLPHRGLYLSNKSWCISIW